MDSISINKESIDSQTKQIIKETNIKNKSTIQDNSVTNIKQEMQELKNLESKILYEMKTSNIQINEDNKSPANHHPPQNNYLTIMPINQKYYKNFSKTYLLSSGNRIHYLIC
jgi:hypothetical protein